MVFMHSPCVNNVSKVAAVAVGLCWFGGFLWAAPPLFGWNRYALEGAGVSCSVVWERADANHSSYIFAIFVCCFIIPLTIIVFSYYGVYKTVSTALSVQATVCYDNPPPSSPSTPPPPPHPAPRPLFDVAGCKLLTLVA